MSDELYEIILERMHMAQGMDDKTLEKHAKNTLEVIHPSLSEGLELRGEIARIINVDCCSCTYMDDCQYNEHETKMCRAESEQIDKIIGITSAYYQKHEQEAVESIKQESEARAELLRHMTEKCEQLAAEIDSLKSDKEELQKYYNEKYSEWDLKSAKAERLLKEYYEKEKEQAVEDIFEELLKLMRFPEDNSVGELRVTDLKILRQKYLGQKA